MGNKAEQLSEFHHTKSGFRKIKKRVKKSTVKRRRKLEKKLQEDTPPRVTEGWID